MDHLDLADGVAEVRVALRGAELRRWSVGGRPLLWEPDAAVWPEVAPILFPVVGWTRGARIAVAGRTYPLGLHGFARTLDFEVLEHWPDHARLRAAADDATRALYPFDWTLEVEHALDGGRLTTTLSVCNDGTAPMPYACGLHPGFAWPFAGGEAEDYFITFGERERGLVPIISPEGLFTRQTRRIPIDGRRLALSPRLLAAEALCFLDAESRGLRFGHAASGAAIDVTLHDFPHIALWSRPGGRFLCIEAWTGHGDFVDASGDLETKPSMRLLAPGATARHAAGFAFSPGHAEILPGA